MVGTYIEAYQEGKGSPCESFYGDSPCQAWITCGLKCKGDPRTPMLIFVLASSAIDLQLEYLGFAVDYRKQLCK